MAPVSALVPRPATPAEPLRTSIPFPATRLVNPSHDAECDIRLPREMKVRGAQRLLKGAEEDLKNAGGSAGFDLCREVQRYREDYDQLKSNFDAAFVPQHSQVQLVGPQNFFTSRLFHVKNRSRRREPHVEFPLDSKVPQGARYAGPELRQGEALVFMALVNLCRDYRVGKQAAFDVGGMCRALSDASYSGQQRDRLKRSIQRLQRATVQFEGFTVQLVSRFEHPNRGDWSVSLDPDIVTLFNSHRTTWLNLIQWRRLSEGLATWLYGYVRSQSRLFPWRIDDLRQRCGCDANQKTFREMLGLALKQLAEAGLIDVGWFLDGEFVHWRLLPEKTASKLQKPNTVAASEQLSLQLKDAGESHASLATAAAGYLRPRTEDVFNVQNASPV